MPKHEILNSIHACIHVYIADANCPTSASPYFIYVAYVPAALLPQGLRQSVSEVRVSKCEDQV